MINFIECDSLLGHAAAMLSKIVDQLFTTIHRPTRSWSIATSTYAWLVNDYLQVSDPSNFLNNLHFSAFSLAPVFS